MRNPYLRGVIDTIETLFSLARRFLLLPILLLVGLTRALAYPDYYDISDREKAQAEARERHLPLAWFGAFRDDLNPAPPDPNVIVSLNNQEMTDLTQMALHDLQGQVVIVFFDATNMAPVPSIVHAQDHIADDGPLEGGASWIAPKVVFTNPAVTRVLGRVSHTQMKATREAAINTVLQGIAADPTALDDAVPTPTAAPTPVPVSPTAPASSSAIQTQIAASSPVTAPIMKDVAEANDEDDMSPDELALWNWCRDNGVYVAIGIGVLLIFLRMGSRPPAG